MVILGANGMSLTLPRTRSFTAAGLIIAMLAGVGLPYLLPRTGVFYSLLVPTLVAAAAVGFVRCGLLFLIPYLVFLDVGSLTLGVANDYVGLPSFGDAFTAQRLEGVILGSQLAVALALACFKPRAIEHEASHSPTPLEIGLFAFFVGGAAAGLVVGLLNQNGPIYLVGDTYKLLLMPALYVLVRLLVKASEVRPVLAAVVWCEFVCTTLVLSLERLLTAGEGHLERLGGPSMLPFIYFLVLFIHEQRPQKRMRYLLLLTTCVFAVAITASRRCWITALVICVLLALTENKGRLVRATTQIVASACVVSALVALFPVTRSLAQAMISDSLSKLHETYVGGRLGQSGLQKLYEVNRSLDGTVRSGRLVPTILGNGSGAQFTDWWAAQGGPGVQVYAETDYRIHNIHNTYSSALFRMGLIGLGVLLVFVTIVLRVLFRLNSAQGGLPKEYRLTVEVLLLFFTVTFLLDMNSIYCVIGEYYAGVLFGLIGVLDREAAFRRKPVVAPRRGRLTAPRWLAPRIVSPGRERALAGHCVGGARGAEVGKVTTGNA
jgi:hypothetical protein